MSRHLDCPRPTAAWIFRYRQHRKESQPENRFRAMASRLEKELRIADRDFRFDESNPNVMRVVERQSIGMALAEFEIRAPHPHTENAIYVRFLTAIIPYARIGDVRTARKTAEKHLANGS